MIDFDRNQLKDIRNFRENSEETDSQTGKEWER
jgi:hypothetical protein